MHEYTHMGTHTHIHTFYELLVSLKTSVNHSIVSVYFTHKIAVFLFLNFTFLLKQNEVTSLPVEIDNFFFKLMMHCLDVSV